MGWKSRSVTWTLMYDTVDERNATNMDVHPQKKQHGNGNLPIFNGRYIFKWLVFQCHVSWLLTQGGSCQSTAEIPGYPTWTCSRIGFDLLSITHVCFLIPLASLISLQQVLILTKSASFLLYIKTYHWTSLVKFYWFGKLGMDQIPNNWWLQEYPPGN